MLVVRKCECGNVNCELINIYNVLDVDETLTDKIPVIYLKNLSEAYQLGVQLNNEMKKFLSLNQL